VASDIESPTRGEPIFDQFGQFTIRYAEFFSKTGVSVNESADHIVIIDEDIAALTLIVIALELRMAAVELRMAAVELRMTAAEADIVDLQGLTVVTAVDYTIDGTTTGHQTIVCTAEITVSLDPAPSDRDTATIKVGQSRTKVIINGNGKLIEEDSTMTLRRRNTQIQIGIDLEFSAELDRWIAK
jgi:hypothetical protein